VHVQIVVQSRFQGLIANVVLDELARVKPSPGACRRAAPTCGGASGDLSGHAINGAAAGRLQGANAGGGSNGK
jgi:hypothetical protein